MMRRLKLLAIVILALLPLTLVSAQDDSTIVIRGFGNITTFNPLMTTDGASYQAYSLLWPAPIDVDSFTGEPVPGLTTWTVSDDGLTYTFAIRPDVLFLQEVTIDTWAAFEELEGWTGRAFGPT